MPPTAGPHTRRPAVGGVESGGFAGLRRGDIDVLVTWLPVEEPDLTVGPALFSDSRVLAVAVGHPLANSFVPSHTPRGHTIVRGPFMTNTDELFTLVSAG